MKNLDIFRTKQKEAAAAMQKAMTSGDEQQITAAWESFQQAVADTVKADFAEAELLNDSRILEQRGVRQLTKAETEYWNKFIEASKSQNYKQAIADIDVSFPETVVEDVYKELKQEHPLLAKVNFQNVSILTKWILSDHSSQKAIWGELNSGITEEITGALKKIELVSNKLSAFMIVPIDMLQLGARFIDNYVRMLLVEAIALGLEYGIVKGNGVKEPVGLIRDIHEGVSYNTETGYPVKGKIKVTDFTPANYGKLLAQLAKTEKGNPRKVNSVLLICNQSEYFKKIMPATTVLNSNGTYASNVFPFPTDVVISNELDDNEAIVCLPEEYFFGIGSDRKGTIEYSDEFKFLEDARTYKIKMHGNGRAYDNTVALYLDITDIDPAFITVKNVAAATGTA